MTFITAPTKPPRAKPKLRYVPRPKKSALVILPAATSFLAAFSEDVSTYHPVADRDVVIAMFRLYARCSYEAARIVSSSCQYCAAGGEDWKRGDYYVANTFLAAVEDEPAGALALAQQCVDEYATLQAARQRERAAMVLVVGVA